VQMQLQHLALDGLQILWQWHLHELPQMVLLTLLVRPPIVALAQCPLEPCLPVALATMRCYVNTADVSCSYVVARSCKCTL
jgi:hypothetical protein